MTTSYRRLILATLGTVGVLALAAASSGAAMAADLHATGTTVTQSHGNGDGGNGQGGNGGGGNGQGGNGNGQGTATPELPSGALFGIGLIPVAAGMFLVWRRRSKQVAA